MATELEGRRSLDTHWYHCLVSVCSNERQEDVLKVHFSEKDEEYIFTLDEARSRLRPQSKCLGKGECKNLEVGDTVLVPSCKTELGKFGFCEAQIREIFRHQHSPSETCNCKVKVSREDGRNEESSRVLVNQVRQVNLCSSIHDNPVIRGWIDSRSKQGSHWLDTSDVESDIHAQLDEEINKITMMTDRFNEAYSTTKQSVADAARTQPLKADAVVTKTEKTTRNLRSCSSTFLVRQRGHRKESSSNMTRSRLPLDKQPRLSPLAARAALAATVFTVSVQQVTPPNLLESKAMHLRSSTFRPNSSPMMAAKNDSNKHRRDIKVKEQSRRVMLARKERGKSTTMSGRHYAGPNHSKFSNIMKSSHTSENAAVDLSIDIPIYEDLPQEMSTELTIELPISKC